MPEIFSVPDFGMVSHAPDAVSLGIGFLPRSESAKDLLPPESAFAAVSPDDAESALFVRLGGVTCNGDRLHAREHTQCVSNCKDYFTHCVLFFRW